MKKTFPLVPLVAILFLAGGMGASANPIISTSSSNAVRINSARIVKSPDGSYVTGMTQAAFGYAAPLAPHVHISVYDAKGRLLIEKIDKINRTRLVRSHLHPRPRAPYAVFLPWTPSQIARVVIVEHNGNIPGSLK